jgi:hypothetical protein
VRTQYKIKKKKIKLCKSQTKMAGFSERKWRETVGETEVKRMKAPKRSIVQGPEEGSL